MSEELFCTIFEKALSDDPDFPLDFEPRWISKLSDDDVNFMSEAEIDILPLTSSRVAAKMTHHDKSILAITGFATPHEIPVGLTEVDPTPGTFALFVVEAQIGATGTASEIRNISEGISSSHPPYNGHGLDQILPIFPEIKFFELDKNYNYLTYLDRTIGTYCAKSLSSTGMSISPPVCIKFSNLFEDGADEIPFFVLLRGMMSESHQILFLDLYRCIEQLYSVPKVSALTKALSLPDPIREISRILEETISWRPKEDEALAALFLEVDKNTCDLIRICFGDCEKLDEPRRSAERAAKKVYKLRNASVHFRPAMQGKDIFDVDWNTLIDAMLSVVTALYGAHGPAYHGRAPRR